MNDSLFITAEQYKSTFFLTDSDLALAIEAGAMVREEMENVYEEHQAWMTMQENFLELIPDEILVELEKMAADNWEDLVAARIDGAYLGRQRKMALMFHSIGFSYEKCLAVSIAYHEIFENVLLRRGLTDFLMLRAFKKIATIGNAIIIDTYNEIFNERMRSQNAILMEMSTPVTQLWDGILFLPLVGIIDSKRAQDIMNTMLNKIADTASKIFVLDISGIAVMDTGVANHIIKMTKATRLMGCTCIISGVSGAVAQTIVELGINTDEIITVSNMKDALRYAFNLTKTKIIAA